jgi:uncharacterized membrane protein
MSAATSMRDKPGSCARSSADYTHSRRLTRQSKPGTLSLMKKTPSIAAIVILAAAALGLVFAIYSTYDYALHLDRQMHSVHCSFIPGAPAAAEDNACKAALFSPYSAIFRATYWGGIPISLFAIGAFSFYAGFGAYLLIAGERAPKIAFGFIGVTGFGPFVASVVMFLISAIKLGSFCKLCVGIYISSIALAVGSGFALVHFFSMGKAQRVGTAPMPQAGRGGVARGAPPPQQPAEARTSPLPALAWLAGLGFAAMLPALVYVASLPDYRPHLAKCGTVALKPEPHNSLIKIPTTRPVQPVTLFEDPLCPSCKAFHQRLIADDIFDKLDVTMVMFPLDTTCNWMLDRSLHPGACLLSGAVLCSGGNARATLEWAYDNQDELRDAGKASPDALKNKIKARFGADIANCADDKKTTVRVNQHLHYASNNKVPISTPQMFLGERRVCEEDTDLGLKYTLGQLAPAVLK